MPATAPPPRDRRAITTVRHLYREIWGYTIPRDDERRVESTAGSEVYGEIGLTAAARLLAYLDPGPDDVLFDLGSGVGKVVLLAGLTTSVRGAVGVEASRTRHHLACRARKQARDEGLDVSRVQLRNADMMRTSLREATIVYSCTTAFSDPFLARLVRRIARLPSGTRLVTTSPIDPHRALQDETTLRLDMSWRRRAAVHVYRVR